MFILVAAIHSRNRVFMYVHGSRLEYKTHQNPATILTYVRVLRTRTSVESRNTKKWDIQNGAYVPQVCSYPGYPWYPYEYGITAVSIILRGGLFLISTGGIFYFFAFCIFAFCILKWKWKVVTAVFCVRSYAWSCRWPLLRVMIHWGQNTPDTVHESELRWDFLMCLMWCELTPWWHPTLDRGFLLLPSFTFYENRKCNYNKCKNTYWNISYV